LVSYPELSAEQQSDLPELLKPASRLPAMFEDSTHELWLCKTVDGPKILKVCNHKSLKNSSFWQGMNGLFNLQFPESLGYMDVAYTLLSKHSPLAIPEPTAYQASVFVLSDFIQGQDVEASFVTAVMVEQLAEHLAALHHVKQKNWGALHQAKFSSQDWSTRLAQTLTGLIKLHPNELPSELVAKALKQALNSQIDDFVPAMIDLRWDQFLHQQGEISAVVDLDAFVFAPRALEFVMLEYLLNDSQAEIFKARYLKDHTMPDLSGVRIAYRLLLFLMNVLGEEDIDVWMASPTRFFTPVLV